MPFLFPGQQEAQEHKNVQNAIEQNSSEQEQVGTIQKLFVLRSFEFDKQKEKLHFAKITLLEVKPSQKC